MANSKSAEKRIKINERNRRANRYYKTSVRTLTKAFFENIESYKVDNNSITKKDLQNTISSIFSLLDKGVKKNVFHRNSAAKQKSRLSAHLKTI